MHTGPIPMIVTADMTLQLIVGSDYGMPISAQFLYSASEPFAVSARFDAGGTQVEWTFARSLLRDGLTAKAGEGDVTCWPATIGGRDVVCIALHSPSGQALLEAPAEDVRQFVTRSFATVADGEETHYLDLDGLIGDLLSDTL